MEKQNNRRTSMFKKAIFAAVCLTSIGVYAAEVPINGTVQSRCVITTDTVGVYGNPNAYTLTTNPADGGQLPIVRFDVTLADAYYAEITAPTSFSTSPSLPDVVTWTGDTEVSSVSDATGMGSYEANKIELGMTDKYDLTATGSTWFKTSSTATMGGNKAFPGGNYTALVEATCVAQ
jgi:hypothetical protein